MNLFDIPVISVAIAIIVSWSLFAIFCGLIHEAIAQVKAERGRFMKNYLLQQLYDAPNGVNWGVLLYLHGNIDLLSRASEKPTSGIDPKLFAETLVDIVANSFIVQMKPSPAEPKYKNKILSDFDKAVQTLLPGNVMNFLSQALKSAESQSFLTGDTDESMIYEKLIENIEKWYTGLTQRLTLWYRKRTRKNLFLIGMILAFLINVDSIQLFDLYKHSSSTSKAVVSFYEKNAAKLASDSINLIAFLKYNDSLEKLSVLPVGFDSSAIKLAILDGKNKTSRTYNFTFWIWKMLGVLISGFAASFGGPFWFDVLKKAYSQKI